MTRNKGHCEREPEVEVTEEMIATGERAVLSRVGGADLGGHFSARDLAILVYQAMERRRLTGLDLDDE